MNCKCINEIDEELREKNLKLVGYAFMLPNFTKVINIKTDWVDSNKAPKGKKRNPPAMLACYCPFCGVKIQKPKSDSDTGN